MNWLGKLHSTARIMGASYQIIMAGLTIFYTIRMSINWDKPNLPDQYFRRNKNASQHRFRPPQRYRGKR